MKMGKPIIFFCSDKPWVEGVRFSSNFNADFEVVWISSEASLFRELDAGVKPLWIFFAFWSKYIKEEIFREYRSVVFHMTNLPFGRGGSPLQNLILRGHLETKLTAIVCSKEVDSGPIYAQSDLELTGSAEEIYRRAASKMPEMISDICRNNPIPTPQIGEPVFFQRRTPSQSELPLDLTLRQFFDFVRMLDAPGYPKAFLDLGNLRFEFSNAAAEDDSVSAKVSITEKIQL